jgi:hypothetical protein
MTSVAYAVTLAVVSATAAIHLDTVTPATADEAVVDTTKYEEGVPVMSARLRTQAEVFASYRNSKIPLAPGQLSELLSAVGFKGRRTKQPGVLPCGNQTPDHWRTTITIELVTAHTVSSRST